MIVIWERKSTKLKSEMMHEPLQRHNARTRNSHEQLLPPLLIRQIKPLSVASSFRFPLAAALGGFVGGAVEVEEERQ